MAGSYRKLTLPVHLKYEYTLYNIALAFPFYPTFFFSFSLRACANLQNGSDHAVVARYSGLYEEGEVEHISMLSELGN